MCRSMMDIGEFLRNTPRYVGWSYFLPKKNHRLKTAYEIWWYWLTWCHDGPKEEEDDDNAEVGRSFTMERWRWDDTLAKQIDDGRKLSYNVSSDREDLNLGKSDSTDEEAKPLMQFLFSNCELKEIAFKNLHNNHRFILGRVNTICNNL